MPSESGWRIARAARRARKPYGQAETSVAVTLDTHSAVLGMRLLQRLGYRVDRPRGDTLAHQFIAQPVARQRRQCKFDFGAQRAAVLQAHRIGLEAGVGRQRRKAHVLAEAPELPVVENAQEDLAVEARELVIGSDVRDARCPGSSGDTPEASSWPPAEPAGSMRYRTTSLRRVDRVPCCSRSNRASRMPVSAE